MNDELDFFIEVDVSNATTGDRRIANHRGVILGKSQNEESKDWFYAVLIYEFGETFMVRGTELTPTGKKVSREAIYGDESLRVIVDPKTGEGELNDTRPVQKEDSD